MKEFRGTPGEFRVYDEHGRFLDAGAWYADNEDENMSSYVPIFAGEKVVALAVMDGYDDTALGLNARLLSASKDLLEALQAIVKHDDAWENELASNPVPDCAEEYHMKFMMLINNARAAIHKALGE